MAGIATGGEERLQTPKDWKLAEQSTGQNEELRGFSEKQRNLG
jgi:hypothetical protein